MLQALGHAALVVFGVFSDAAHQQFQVVAAGSLASGYLLGGQPRSQASCEQTRRYVSAPAHFRYFAPTRPEPWRSPVSAGEVLALVAPCGPPDRDRLLQGVGILDRWGLRWEAGPLVQHYLQGGSREHPFLSASDERRAEELAWALGGRFSGCWAVRGGYGLSRLLERLDPGVVPTRLLGFSDVTALLLWAGRLGWHERLPGSLVHCANVQTLPLLDGESLEWTRRALIGDGSSVLSGRILRPGQAEGPLWGGNLCLLAHLCGTPWSLPPGPKILLLEDVNEAAYRLDRMLMQLQQSRALQGLQALLLGEFVGCAGAEQLWCDWGQRLGVPVLTHLPVGHGSRNWPLRLGQSVRLQGEQLIAL